MPLDKMLKGKQYYASLHTECTLVDSCFNEKRKKSPVIQFADLADVYGWTGVWAQRSNRAEQMTLKKHCTSTVIFQFGWKAIFPLSFSHSLCRVFLCANQTWSSAGLQVQSIFDVVLNGLQCDSHQLGNNSRLVLALHASISFLCASIGAQFY